MDSHKQAFQDQVDVPKNSKHHIVPSSRISKKQARHWKNIAFVNSELHRKFHSLMLNRTPFEILEFLERYFWGGDKSIIDAYCERRR